MHLTCHPCKCHLSAFYGCVGQVEDLFQDFDHTRFGAIVSDNGGGCENARKLVVKITSIWLRRGMHMTRVESVVQSHLCASQHVAHVTSLLIMLWSAGA